MPESFEEWMERLTVYEDIHENPKITLSQDEILALFQETLKSLEEKKHSSTDPFERKMLFLKKCIVLQLYDDLLQVPDKSRPWTASESKWLEEMKAREKL